MKPEKPITRKEMYLDVATGGSTELPSPVTREEKYLAKIAGESVDVPTPVTRYEMLLAAVAGESYTLTPVTRLEIYLAKAAGQDVEVPQPITREEMYWFDYVSGQPTPSEQEYTGAVPVTFTANGQPLLDYLIIGNEEHSGTPTPDNPIMPQGTGERTGNLFSSVWEQGSINGTTGHNEVAGTLVRTKDYIPIKPNIAYSFKRDIANGYMNVRLYRADKSYIGAGTTSTIRLISGTLPGNPMGNNTSFCCFEVIDSEAAYIRFNDSSNNTAAKWLMVEGEYTQQTMPDYEPYGYKIPISSANTTTPVYLGEVQSTRRVKKLVLTGEEGWERSQNQRCYYINASTGCPTDYLKQKITTSICSHYQSQNNTASGLNEVEAGHFCFYIGGGFELYIGETTISSVADFKAYLAAQYAAGTPVTVWYVLANEKTGIVNEPLMRIGDYSDTLSMEQAGVSIPTANGSTTLDVETTVKPSEIYIKYRGEAVATLSSLPAEVSSPEETPEEVNPEETEETENGSEDVSLQYKPEAIE